MRRLSRSLEQDVEHANDEFAGDEKRRFRNLVGRVLRGVPVVVEPRGATVLEVYEVDRLETLLDERHVVVLYEQVNARDLALDPSPLRREQRYFRKRGA